MVDLGRKPLSRLSSFISVVQYRLGDLRGSAEHGHIWRSLAESRGVAEADFQSEPCKPIAQNWPARCRNLETRRAKRSPVGLLTLGI